jgi:hypothetical protein
MDITRSLATLATTSLVVALGVSGCGGGSSSSGTVNGLTLPSSMSVVSASSGAGAARVAPAGLVKPAGETMPTTSDYVTDVAHKYVYDDSMQSLQTVNMILCLMSQTRASDKVNAGAYLALVNENKCDQGKNQSSGGQAGVTVAQLNKWTIQSERADNSSPMIVKMWVPDSSGGSENILVELTATQGVGTDNPFGVFSLNFKGVNPDTNTQSMAGNLSADGLSFQYFSSGDRNGTYTEAAHVVFNDVSGSAGQARTMRSESGGGSGSSSSDYALDFDVAHVLRSDMTSSTDACLTRSDFTTHVWRYNLYYNTSGAGHSIGDRVALNSGFPFTYNSGAGTANGYVGYNGVWVEGGGTLADATTITRQEFNGGTPAAYTVHVSNGKLIKRAAQSLPLANLLGQTLYFWGENPTTHAYNQWVVAMDSGNNFAITGSVQFGNNGPQTTPVTPVDITPSVDGQNLWLWSDALGGNVVYVYHSGVQSPDVTVYAESFVQPDDATLFSGSDVTVYCYDRCLKGGLTGAVSVESDLYHATSNTPYTYTLQSASGKLVLLDDLNNQAVDASVVDLSAINHEGGVQSGEMVLSSSNISNPWDVYQQPVTYRWETGANPWNHLTTVTANSGGQFASFDKPLHFTYTVGVGDDLNGNAHDGATYLLQYGGPGELQGFPWVAAQGSNRWYAEVNLHDGVVLTEDSTATQMVLRPVEMEQTMNSTVAGDCSLLDTTGAKALSIPTASDSSVSFNWSDRPTNAPEAPAVIEGVLQ